MVGKNPWDDDSDEDSQEQESDSGAHMFDSLKKKMPNFTGKDKNFSSKSLKTAAFTVVALYLLSGFHKVQYDENGVVLRFGKWVRTVDSGLKYVLPYPFEQIILQKVTRVNQIDISSNNGRSPDETLMLTGDLNLANISFSVLWKVKEGEVENYLFNTQRPETSVRAIAESVMREIVGQTDFTYIQTEGRGEIQQKAREQLQKLMDQYKTGVEIVRVELQKVEPPASVIDSFRDVERAQAEQQSEKNRAEAYDRDTRARTRGLAAEKINRGEAEKRYVIEKAKGRVARFLSAYSQYKAAPDVTAKRLYMDTLREIYKNIDKVIVQDSANTVSLLPLNDFIKKSKVSENQNLHQENQTNGGRK